MATYYWFGGTGNWDTTTTHWSLTSGNSGGVLAPNAPTSADDVVFDSASNATAYTVTLLTSPVCRSVTIAGPAAGNVTVAGSAAWSIYGSMTLASTGITRTYNGIITFAATTTGWTISSGVTLNSNLNFNGVGGGWTLGSSFTTTGSLTVTAGAFSTGNFALSAYSIIATGSATRSISLGSSSVTLSNISGGINLASTGLTWSAGTSTITLTGYAASITAYSGIVFNNVTFTRTGSVDGTDTASIGQIGCTFNTLTISTPTTGVIYFNFPAGTTNVSTLSVTGTNITTRTLIKSAAFGSAATINLTNNSTVSNADFRDITVSGTGSITSAVGCGDCGGNSGIPFPAAKTVYWNLAGSNNWSSTGWATTQTGAPAIANFPLAQDTALFTDTNPAASGNITLNGTYNLPTFSFAARTLTLTFATGAKLPICYGDTVLSTAIIVSGTGSISYGGRGNTQTITSAGRTWTQPLIITNIGGTVRLSDACTRNGLISPANGTLDLNGFALTGTAVSSSVSTARTLAFGTTGTITLTSAGIVWTTATTTNLSITGTDPKVYVTNATATATTVTPGTAAVTRVLSFYFTAGTYTLSISALSVVNSLDFTGFAGTGSWGILYIHGNLKLSTGMTINPGGSLSFASTATGRTITSNGKILDSSVSFSGVGGSWILQDALTLVSTSVVALVDGTFDLNGFTSTIGSLTTVVGTKNITFNGGTLIVLGSGTTAFDNSNSTGFTTTAGTGTGSISLTSASAKTFVGGGSTYNCTLNQGGAGALTITGANTFNNITNSIQPATVTFPASTTNTFANFNLNGTAGNLITINSSTAGTQATLSKASGAVTGSYLSIQDSKAIGGATWAAIYSTNVSNNTGWNFGSAYALSITENFTPDNIYTIVLGALNSLVENVNSADSSTQQSGFLQSLTENYTAQDVDTIIAQYPAAVVEDTQPNDTAALTAQFAQTTAEGVVVQDLADVYAVFSTSLVENFTAEDVATITQGYYLTRVENFTSDDTSAQVSAFLQTLTENITAADTLSITATFQGSVTEALTSAETIVASTGVYLALVENVVSAETEAVQAGFTPTINEGFTPNDSSTQVCQFYFSAAEAVTVAEHLEVHGWIKIPDAQNANWQAIADAQTPNWISIDDAQNPNWADILDGQ